jgi:phosphate uptake regulator|tara:strand:+ start:17071 stop:18000 length:930 start_codon:yes stop_codon:yes gene_type:complete
VVNIKRKVIQIANSTQLISLPRKWSQKYGIKKGDEIEVEENGSKITVRTDKSFSVEKAELNIDNLDPMVLRSVTALYKRGVDEIKITFNKPELIKSIQDAIGKEAVGYEITEQGKDYCIIKHVSGELEDFEPVLRRTFLLLISMANESLESIKRNDFDNLKNVAFLEEANNRFTTNCRRFLNKKGYKDSRKLGPLYYIIEEIENIADQYKYLCYHIYKYRNKKIKLNKEILEIFQETNEMLNTFYELFYKFDQDKLVAIGKQRNQLVDRFLRFMEKSFNPIENLTIHQLLTIMQKTFCLVGPYMVINYD